MREDWVRVYLSPKQPLCEPGEREEGALGTMGKPFR